MKKATKLFVMVLLLCLTSLSLFAQYDNSPTNYKYVPSVIWAPALGGGTWYSEIQIWAETPGTEVVCWFDYDGGFRGPYTLFTSVGLDDCYRTTNILATISALDPTSFVYYGKSGALNIRVTGGLTDIQVMARTNHTSGYAKTIPGVSGSNGNTASQGRYLMLLNVNKSTTYRHFVTLYNVGSSCTVYAQIIQNNSPIGIVSKSMGSYNYKAFDVFADAGLTGTYYNCFVLIWASNTGGRIICGGATAHNGTNDPAYHLPVGWK